MERDNEDDRPIDEALGMLNMLGPEDLESGDESDDGSDYDEPVRAPSSLYKQSFDKIKASFGERDLVKVWMAFGELSDLNPATLNDDIDKGDIFRCFHDFLVENLETERVQAAVQTMQQASPNLFLNFLRKVINYITNRYFGGHFHVVTNQPSTLKEMCLYTLFHDCGRKDLTQKEVEEFWSIATIVFDNEELKDKFFEFLSNPKWSKTALVTSAYCGFFVSQKWTQKRVDLILSVLEAIAMVDFRFLSSFSKRIYQKTRIL